VPSQEKDELKRKTTA